MLNKSDKEYLLGISPNDIDFKLLDSLLSSKARFVDGKFIKCEPRMETYEEFDLLPGEYINKEKVRTNVGLFIFNKLIVERDFSDVIGYWNTVLDSGGLKKFEKVLSKALLTKKVSKSQIDTYLDRIQWLSLKMHMILSGSFTMATLKPNSKVVAFRDKFVKDNKELIENGDVPTAVKLEKSLLDIASAELGDDLGMDLYKSGSRGSFGNNFKNISIMRGPMYNPILGRSETITTNFMEGISKKDIPSYANGVIAGSYPKAVGTQTSGYLGKKLIALLQTTTIDNKLKDCGSKGYITVSLTDKNKDDFIYRYIITNSGVILLTDENFDKYIGKTVRMRSPLYCTSNKLCAYCAGTSHTNQDINNIGLTSTRVASTMLNMAMKKFHDTSVKMNTIDIAHISV